MTSAGSIGVEGLPYLAVLRDAPTVNALIANGHMLLVTSDLNGAILLRALGLAAVPVSGLEKLDRRGLEWLSTLFGVKCSSSELYDDEAAQPAAPDQQWASELDQDACTDEACDDDEDEIAQPAAPLQQQTGEPDQDACLDEMCDDDDEEAVEAAAQPAATPQQQAGSLDQSAPAVTESEPRAVSKPIEIVLVGWSLQALQTNFLEGLQAAIDRLKDFHRFRGLDLLRISVWTPTTESLASIRFGIEQHEADWVRDAILESLDSQFCCLEDLQRHDIAAAEPVNLASATEQLVEALAADDGSGSRRGRKEAMASYRRLTYEKLIKPLLRDAEAMSDPLKAAQQAQFAQLTNVFLAAWPSAMEAELPANSKGLAVGFGKDSPLAALLATGKQMIALGQQLQKCKRNPSIKKNRAPLTITAKPAGNLALPQSVSAAGRLRIELA
jgi:hypothetical protein